jgi:transcription initiation factor TFIIE subunit alpha
VVNIKKNEKSRKAYSKKIDEIKKDMQQTFWLFNKLIQF